MQRPPLRQVLGAQRCSFTGTGAEQPHPRRTATWGPTTEDTFASTTTKPWPSSVEAQQPLVQLQGSKRDCWGASCWASLHVVIPTLCTVTPSVSSSCWWWYSFWIIFSLTLWPFLHDYRTRAYATVFIYFPISPFVAFCSSKLLHWNLSQLYCFHKG